MFCSRGGSMRCIRSPVLPKFELFSLHYDEIPGQRISLLTAHSSGRSMTYMPNVSMSRSHKTAGLPREFLVTVSLSANRVSIYPGAILRLPIFAHIISATRLVRVATLEHTSRFKRHKVIIPAVPLFKLGSAAEPGRG